MFNILYRLACFIEGIGPVDDRSDAMLTDKIHQRLKLFTVADTYPVQVGIAFDQVDNRKSQPESRQVTDDVDVTATPEGGDRLRQGAFPTYFDHGVHTPSVRQFTGGLTPVGCVLVVDSVVGTQQQGTLQTFITARGDDDACPHCR